MYPDVHTEFFKNLHRDAEIIDLRPIANRWDDVLVVIKKGVN